MTDAPSRHEPAPGLAGRCRPRAAEAPAGKHPGGGGAAGERVAESGPFDKAVAEALSFVLRSTANRPQTEAELITKLERQELAGDVIDAALARARQVGAVDDVAFAAAWVEDRGRQRGYGQARLRRELRRREVPDGIVDAALARLDDRDDLAVATDLALRRAQQLPGSLQPEAVARRLVGFLARRGYSEGLARRAAITASGLDREWD